MPQKNGCTRRLDFLKQEEIPLTPYLETRIGNYYNIGHKSRQG